MAKYLKWSRLNTKIILFIILLTVVCFITIKKYYKMELNIYDMPFGRILSISRKQQLLMAHMDDQYIIKTPGCLIERLDPWEPTLKRYFGKTKPFKCPKNPINILIQQSDDKLIVDNEAKLSLINSTNSTNRTFFCEKRTVYRNQLEKYDWKTYRISSDFEHFVDKIPMKEEYAQVKCYIGNATVYHDYFFNVIRKQEIEIECEVNSKLFLLQHPECVDRLSVLVLGVDSVSRPNFIRQMPLTFSFLTDKLSAIDMLGYNKVGLNTFPCLMPYLTGQSVDELTTSCWGGGSWDTFDNCTFLWDLFAHAGYRTAYVENMDRFGLLVYNKAGSQRQIAHYYGHTLYIPVWKYSLNYGCWRGEDDDYRVAEWSFKFQKQFSQTPHFGHFWMSIWTHNYVNKAQNLDPIVVKVIAEMHKTQILNNTLLIFMSDHGVRYGTFRGTNKGRQEENLPFMYLVFPQWFKDKYPAAINQLYHNRQRLITTFDLHETLKDVINCSYATKESNTPKSHRGISLFQPVSDQRTCQDAGIPEIYCACKENAIPLDKNGEIALKMGKLLVRHLNNETELFRTICAKFQLKQVLSFQEIVKKKQDPSKYQKDVFSSFIITIQVTPGDGHFEANIQYISKSKSYSVHPDIRRVNRYGDTSHCINEKAILKSICYCKQQIT